ncbi:putative glyoxalase superfamily protein PhnB [Brevibacterium sanguinis]|uniref:Glyoxalase superfamily protein PhnB n=2 Tax=Brevibacterium TaxID=1696 RepID=A0ABX9GM32_9MICO|nr:MULTISPECIES: VOC family protein [Brevibacterium]RBP63124.1 putative glyoxalase superfamily protein PhnB [Brevibacterium sanguinis]RBP69700.1 putative glyoxalase superfamily protein PhnB [Brevibacterium celere]
MTTTVFPAFRTTDAEATAALLVTLGFTERLTVRDEDEPRTVVHAEYALGETGGIMFGSVRHDGSALDSVGGSSVYVVVDSEREVDRLYREIRDMGHAIVNPVATQPHGGRAFDFRDHDGNSWGVGSYRGA